jgi:hypothetical protein
MANGKLTQAVLPLNFFILILPSEGAAIVLKNNGLKQSY